MSIAIVGGMHVSSTTADACAPPVAPAEDPFAAYAAGRSIWGDLALGYPQFVEHTRGLERAAMAAHAADLYLCAACAAGHPRAYQTIEALHFPALSGVLQRLLGDPGSVQEVLQELRIRLFVGPAPRIASYRGSGSLFAWLRTIAIHAAHDQLRASSVQRGRLRRLSLAQRELGASHLSPGERLLDGQPREQLIERACSAAIASLQREQAQLLRHYFVSGLSIDELSPLYAVHRATIARRIRRAIEHIRAFARRELKARLQLSAEELDELVRDSCAEVDLSEGLASDRAPLAARRGAARRSAMVTLPLP